MGALLRSTVPDLVYKEFAKKIGGRTLMLNLNIIKYSIQV